MARVQRPVARSNAQARCLVFEQCGRVALVQNRDAEEPDDRHKDAGDELRPAPVDARDDERAADDGAEDGSAYDGKRVKHNGRGALRGCPDVAHDAPRVGDGRGSEDAEEEVRDQQRLRVLGRAGREGEHAAHEVRQQHGRLSPVDLRDGAPEHRAQAEARQDQRDVEQRHLLSDLEVARDDPDDGALDGACESRALVGLLVGRLFKA